MIEPRLMTTNILNTSTAYTISAGTDTVYAPLSNAFETVPTRPAMPTTDANGVFECTIHVNRYTRGFGRGGFGRGGFGFGIQATSLILGVSRHEPNLARFNGGFVTLISNDDGVSILNNQRMEIYPTNRSVFFNMPYHTTSSYTLRIEGLTPSTPFNLPLLYIGGSFTLGGVSYVYDDYAEKANFKSFRSDNGVGYDVAKFTQFTASPKFAFITHDKWGKLRDFREDIIEQSKPFWYMFDETKVIDIYLVKQKGNFAASTINNAPTRSLNLSLEEWL